MRDRARSLMPAHRPGPPSVASKRGAIASVVMAVIAVAAVAAAAVWWFVLPSSAERTARADVEALGAAVADHVAGTGRLPRVTVAPGASDGGETTWGADFLVESTTVPRADPSSARTFFLVGDADNWCVEALYIPRSVFSDSSGAWVSAKGVGGDVGKVVDGRCGADSVLVLSPVTTTDVPEPGTVIAVASAPVGTCFADPFSADSAGEPEQVVVVACDSGHFGEVFLAGEGSGDDLGAYEEEAAGSCASAFGPFVGVPRNLSAFTAEPFTVDEAAWARGDRDFTCFLYLSTDDYPLVGTARDSWR